MTVLRRVDGRWKIAVEIESQRPTPLPTRTPPAGVDEVPVPHPPQLQSPEGQKLLAALRDACAHLPEVEEVVDGFGHTTFKVRKKSFVIAGMGEEGGSVSIKADLPSQALLVRRGPFYRTPYIGHHGWVTLDAPLAHPWAEVEALIEDGWRLAAPKRVLRAFDGGG